ncbi:hypothetical protein DERF_005418 [Dermatophagoides farinae]|uniref:Uncharacterized protein n=1 Tax=Dermatophagoides farinae TaxID=6954 RepID=A0A922I5S9_DERFA|nr:hypothetical protein DERF_005418 [Dermatophagoides farinae]
MVIEMKMKTKANDIETSEIIITVFTSRVMPIGIILFLSLLILYQVTCTNGTNIQRIEPNGHSFNKILAILNGILTTVIIRSDNARFVIKRLVDIRNGLRLNTT